VIIVLHIAGRTRSVDVTISNILEGVVTYVPQMESSQSSSPVNTLAQDSKKNIPSASTSTHTLASTVQVIIIRGICCMVLEIPLLCLTFNSQMGQHLSQQVYTLLAKQDVCPATVIALKGSVHHDT
jgi:hypothetical protein